MEKTMTYRPRGTCSSLITYTLDGDIVKEVHFQGGCSGNTQGVAALVQGMKAEDAIDKLKGIRCGFKATSCPDQLALALESGLAQEDEVK